MENQTHNVSPCLLKRREINICLGLGGRNGNAPMEAFLLVQQFLDFLPPSETETERHKDRKESRKENHESAPCFIFN